MRRSENHLRMCSPRAAGNVAGMAQLAIAQMRHPRRARSVVPQSAPIRAHFANPA